MYRVEDEAGKTGIVQASLGDTRKRREKKGVLPTAGGPDTICCCSENFKGS